MNKLKQQDNLIQQTALKHWINRTPAANPVKLKYLINKKPTIGPAITLPIDDINAFLKEKTLNRVSANT